MPHREPSKETKFWSELYDRAAIIASLERPSWTYQQLRAVISLYERDDRDSILSKVVCKRLVTRVRLLFPC